MIYVVLKNIWQNAINTGFNYLFAVIFLLNSSTNDKQSRGLSYFESMQLIFRVLLCLSFWTINPLTATLLAQVEVCDNAKDDDGDGLIDLNDEDCQCSISEPISLIPNPSFEDQTCCPNNRSQMNCADTWIQASAPTTDYIHTCDWLGWENLPIPLPIPDGEGVIGFRDGRFAMAGSNTGNGNNGINNNNGGNNNNSSGGTNANFKEYAGACLIRPLRREVSYKFQFY
ncbi:MAG: hypothetical protein AAGJ18_17225, partial [Bacteroidota bacterium]